MVEVWVYVKLFVLIGFMWIFQIVDVFLFLFVFFYVVVIFNGLQGFFFFLSYVCNICVWNLCCGKKVLQVIKNGNDIRKNGQGQECIYNLKNLCEISQGEQFDVYLYFYCLFLVFLCMWSVFYLVGCGGKESQIVDVNQK